VSEAPFEDAPVTIQADRECGGYSGEEIVAQLLDGDGKKVEEQKQRANGNEQMLAFRFRLKPDKRGLCFYQGACGGEERVGSIHESRSHHTKPLWQTTAASLSWTVARGHTEFSTSRAGRIGNSNS
jgi:hypothetical protein